MSLLAKVAGGLISSIAGRNAQKKMASSYNTAANQMPVFTQEQQNAMRDRLASMASGQFDPNAVSALSAPQMEALDLSRAKGLAEMMNRIGTSASAGGIPLEFGKQMTGGLLAARQARADAPDSYNYAMSRLAAQQDAMNRLYGMNSQNMRMAQGMQGARQGMAMQGAAANAAAGTMIPGALGQIGNTIYQDALYRKYMDNFGNRGVNPGEDGAG